MPTRVTYRTLGTSMRAAASTDNPCSPPTIPCALGPGRSVPVVQSSALGPVARRNVSPGYGTTVAPSMTGAGVKTLSVVSISPYRAVRVMAPSDAMLALPVTIRSA